MKNQVHGENNNFILFVLYFLGLSLLLEGKDFVCGQEEEEIR